ncbi:hypothetical protein SAMN04487905_103359 [Actinopolyspora xinjiangensis]|uniref:Uncharacterized protein n=2 Tax=Actinopolyspora xinjiangensis TaxID=405564 RepID=A0A1H0S330_9ACTN|nr:hypothetical protein SAMN04487905_103359 [Actinopolyspora xinjiangensis]
MPREAPQRYTEGQRRQAGHEGGPLTEERQDLAELAGGPRERIDQAE